MNRKLELKTSLIKILLCTVLIVGAIPVISQATTNGFTELVKSPSITIAKPSTKKLEPIKVKIKSSYSTLKVVGIYNGEKTKIDNNDLLATKLIDSKKMGDDYTEMIYQIPKRALPKKNKKNTITVIAKASNAEIIRKVVIVTNKNGKYYDLDNAPNITSIKYTNNNVVISMSSKEKKLNTVKIKDTNNSTDVNVNTEIKDKTAETKIKVSNLSLKDDEYYRIRISVKDQNGAYAVKNVAFKLPENVNVTAKKKGEVTSFKLNKSKAMIEVGKSTKLTATNIKPNNALTKTPIFTSSNTKIAKVDESGNIYGVKEGKAVITAKMDNIEKQITVTVLPVGDKVYFLDVQDLHGSEVQGSDAIIIESNGKYGMIDTGVSYQKNRVLQYLKDLDIKQLDFILITHLHSDHIGGYEAIANSDIKVKKLYIKNTTNNNFKPTLAKIKAVSSKKNIKIKYVSENKNKSITLGNYKFNLLNRNIQTIRENGLENMNSIVALANVNGKKIYFAGDIQNDPAVGNYTEDVVAKQVGKVDVYKVAHHLYNANNSETALSYLKPTYAVVTNVQNHSAKTANGEARLGRYVSSDKKYYTASGTTILTINAKGNISFTQLEADG